MEALTMDAPDTESGARQAVVETVPLQPVSLEAAELELALQSQDMFDHGFAGAVRHALETLQGTLLFDMPGSLLEGYQRVTAVSTGVADDRRIFLIHLADDGAAIRVEEANGDADPLSGFANSCMQLMDRWAA